MSCLRILRAIFFFLLLFPISLSAQWFEGNLYLPDSFSGTCGTDAITWNSSDDRIYLRGFNETFVAIDGESDEKTQPIRINGNDRSHPGWFEWNQGNNCLYIWCSPYCAFYDSLHIVDCRTLQTVSVITFPRNNFGAVNLAQMCANPVSNKVYLIKEDNHAGQGYDTLIYVIGGSNHQVIKRIRFYTYSVYHPNYPSLKWNPVNNCLYGIGRTLDSDTAGLAVIDCTRDSIINFTHLPYDVLVERNSFVLDSLRNRLYFSLNDTLGKGIYEFDCSTNNVVQRINIPNAFHGDAIDFALDPENSKIYYTNINSLFIYVIDVASGRIADSIFVGQPTVYLSFYQPNHELYCTGGDTLSVIDLTTNSVNYYSLPDESGVTARPFLHPARGKLYLERGGEGEAIVVFDCLTKTVRKVIYNGTQKVGDILLNPIEHKLYCTNNFRPYIFVFNSETNQPIHQVQVAPKGYGLACFGFAPPHDKVYISYPHHIAVLDSRSDSVIKTIGGLIGYYLFAYNPIVDKLYTLDIDDFGAPNSYVIDCRTDSIIKVLNATWSPDQEGDIEFDSLTNRVYMTGNVGGMVVIDCFNDSVIKRDSNVLRGDIHFRPHSDRRVYAGKGMYDRFNDSLIGYLPFDFDVFAHTEYNSIDDKLYVAQYPSDNNKIYVVDCNNSSISDSILGGMPGFVTGLFWNKLNDKLYFSPLDNQIWYEPVVVADCRTNEIIATFPQIDRADLDWVRCLNLSNNRFYVNVRDGSRLGMIRDNFYGIEEMQNQRVELKVYPTMGRRFNIESDENIVLKIYNALGEKVTELPLAKDKIITWEGKDREGKKLSNGIYFIMIGTKNRLIKKLILL